MRLSPSFTDKALDQGFSKFTFKCPNGNYLQRQKVRNNCYYKNCLYKHTYYFITFTFSHLADAFIQSDLQLGST